MRKLISRELVGGAALSVAVINCVVAAFDGACHCSVICAADARTKPSGASPGTAWRHIERISHISAGQYGYLIDTSPGHSGGPVFNPANSKSFAIHVKGTGNPWFAGRNAGLRFTSTVVANYGQWGKYDCASCSLSAGTPGMPAAHRVSRRPLLVAGPRSAESEVRLEALGRELTGIGFDLRRAGSTEVLAQVLHAGALDGALYVLATAANDRLVEALESFAPDVQLLIASVAEPA